MATKYPDKVAFVFCMNDHLHLTYSEIRSKSYLLAANLASLGLKKGERIAYLLPNTHELVMLYFAASIAGLISVPLDADYGSAELDYMINKTEPSAVVVFNCSEYQKLIGDLFPDLNTGRPDTFKSKRFPFVRHVIVINDKESQDNNIFTAARSYEHLANNRIDFDHSRFPLIDCDDIFAILFTVFLDFFCYYLID